MPVELIDLLFPGGSVAAGAWLFYRLFVRVDRRERDLFEAMREQRDDWRSRAEACEQIHAETTHQLVLYRARYGPLE